MSLVSLPWFIWFGAGIVVGGGFALWAMRRETRRIELELEDAANMLLSLGAERRR